VSVDYEHLAACASLPSSSLVKERGDFRLQPQSRLRVTREAGLIPLPNVAVNLFFTPARPASPPSEPPRRSAERGFYSRYRSVSTAFFRLNSEANRPLVSPPHPTRRLSAERGFYRSQRTVSTTFFGSISTTYAAFLKPFRLTPEGTLAERRFYRAKSPVSTAFSGSISTACAAFLKPSANPSGTAERGFYSP